MKRLAVWGAVAIGTVALAAVLTLRSYVEDLRHAEARIIGRSRIIETRFGTLEYALAGSGPPLLMIHGTGGGFDQALTFSEGLIGAGRGIIAPSRFGYLRSDQPADPSPANQADALADLLDHLGVERLPVAGGSAGAISAVQFALRHPERCSALILIVPAAYRPVEGQGGRNLAVELLRPLLSSDFLFWMAMKTMPDRLIETFLATDPALIERTGERDQALRILAELLPVSRRAEGFLNDAMQAGNPSPVDYSAIKVPTLIISAQDDGFGTAGVARYAAGEIPDARLVLFPDGGHILTGRSADTAAAIECFLASLE